MKVEVSKSAVFSKIVGENYKKLHKKVFKQEIRKNRLKFAKYEGRSF